MSVRVERVPFGEERVQRLVERVQQEYVVRYGGEDDTPLEPTEFVPPQGRFFVVSRDDVPVAMGGWRPGPSIDDLGATSTAEIKRMFVVAEARRTGMARLLLRALEESARNAGHDVMVLETGLKQPEAIALYESSGYVPVTSFGHYAWSPLARCYGRRIAPERAGGETAEETAAR